MRRLLIMLSFAALLIPAACKKYSDGPFFSALPRTERIANKWRFVQVELNGKDSTSLFREHIVEYTNTGTAIYQKGNIKYFGTWQLNNSAKDLDVDYDSLGRSSFSILKLKNNEFWYRDRRTNWTYKLEPF